MSSPDLARIQAQVEQLVRAGRVKELRAVRDQLQDAVDARRVTQAQARWSAAPVDWAQHRGIHLWSRQRAVAASVNDNKRTSVRAGHAVGKSFLAATLAAWWTDTRPNGIVISTAPSAEQVHGILWEEIRALHRMLKLPGRIGLNDRWIVGDRIAGFGRKPPDVAAGSDFDGATMQGYHRSDGVLFVIDEASGVPEWLWTAAETVTTSDNSRILAIGNADNPGSHFARVCAGRPGWANHKISVFDSPAFTGEEVPERVLAALVTRLWEEDRREDWGVDDPRYVGKVLAEFPDSHPLQVVRAADLAQCWLPVPRAPEELLPVELGVDVGGGGDETVVRERRGVKAGREWRERSENPATVARLVLHAIHETGATSVKVDSIGIGAGVVGELRNLRARGDHDARIHGINVAEKASDPAKFANLRAELWWTIGRIGSERREWDLSEMENADVTHGQLLGPRYSYDVKGRIVIEKKADVIAREGRSPDNADALLLSYVVPSSAAQDYWDALATGRLRR